MQDYFTRLPTLSTTSLHPDEFYTCTFHAEDSDFVRFNRSAIRQAGTVVFSAFWPGPLSMIDNMPRRRCALWRF